LLKKLLAILLIGALYAPHIARLVMYTECTLQATSTQQCDCNLSNVPDWQTSFPEKQKEIQQQTDWKFLLNDKPLVAVNASQSNATTTGNLTHTYSFIFINSVFHPPGLTATIA